MRLVDFTVNDFNFFKIKNVSENWIESLESNLISLSSSEKQKGIEMVPKIFIGLKCFIIAECENYHAIISFNPTGFTSWWQKDPKNYENPYAVFNCEPREGKPSYLGFTKINEKLNTGWHVMQKGKNVKIKPESDKDHYNMNLSTKICDCSYYETWLIEGKFIMNFLKNEECVKILKNYGENFLHENVEIIPFSSYESMLEY